MNESPDILVIDDDGMIRISIVDSLTNDGYHVIFASNGRDGLQRALEHHPKMIILDYKMPDMDGLQTLEELRKDEWGRKVEVIFATNTYDMTVINAAIALGVHDYILKADTSLDQFTVLAQKYIPS